jgi:hypothetical protein
MHTGASVIATQLPVLLPPRDLRYHSVPESRVASAPSPLPCTRHSTVPYHECVKCFISLKYGSGCRGSALAARDAAPRGVEPVVRDAPIPLILAPQAHPCARSRCINAGPYTDATARGDGVRKGARVYMCRKILVSVSSLSLSLALSVCLLPSSLSEIRSRHSF